MGRLIANMGLFVGLTAATIIAFMNTCGDIVITAKALSAAAPTAIDVIAVYEIPEPETKYPQKDDLDDSDEYLLAKLAMAEAEGEDTKGKALVMRVVINRVEYPGFPDTIEDVIYDEGQFSPIASGKFDDIVPNDDCYKALELLQSWDESEGALYFESESTSEWHKNNLKFLFKYGNHYFYTEE